MERFVMAIEPDEIIEPDDELPRGVIDVTPRKKKQGIDFASDMPPIEQLLQQHELDRSDKKPGFFERSDHPGLGALMILFVALLILIILSLIF